MTNGEKIQETFPNMRITVCESYVQVMGEKYEFNNTYPLDWWNAEYQEPSSSEIPKNSPTETLVSLDVYNQVAKERNIAIQQLHELGYEFGQKIEPVIRDNGVKDELNRVKNELEPTTKNDLGVDDCISRQALLNATIKKSSIWNHITNSEGDNLEAIVSKLPPATPIRPKGHWIDTDATHSKCSRCWAVFEIASANGEVNYCPNCGAKMEGEA